MRKPDGKIVLLGDMNVGKTSLLQRYMERRFPDTVSTVGGAFYLKQWRSFNISIWDTAGEGGAAGTGCLPGFVGLSSHGVPTSGCGIHCPSVSTCRALLIEEKPLVQPTRASCLRKDPCNPGGELSEPRDS